MCLQLNAQTCIQTFTASGQDSGPTVLTINSADITCNGANPISSLKLTNAAGSLTSFYCSTDGTEWFGFNLSIDGGAPITGCATTFNNLDITGFTTLTITSFDDDSWSDSVTITIGVEATFVPMTPPSCVTVSSPVNGAINVSSSIISWPAAAGGATGYRLSVGSMPGATDVLNNFDVGNVLSYPLSGLVGGTTYYVTITPYNSFGTATGCTESNFTTCDELGDFSENFDGLTATNLIPDCWSRVLSDGVSTYASVGTSGTNFSAPYSISLYNSSSPSTSNIMLVTPYINNLSAGTNRLRFMARNQYSDTQDIIVGTMSNPADASTFTPLQTVDINDTFAQYIVDFTGYAGTNKYIALKRLSTSTYTYVYIDNVIWEAVPASAPTCATNIVATPDSACGNFANSITWTATSGADGYYITVGTTTGGTDIANNINLGNVLTYSFTGNAGSMYYYTIYPFNAIGTASGCTEGSFTTNANGCYCISVPTSNDNDGITNVQIGSNNFPTGDVMYFDHTATVVDLAQGINANVQVTFATEYDYHTNVWIDFNDNYTFESSELVYQGQSSDASPTTLNASFIMPATAALGQHRMRIGTADYGQEIPDPCYSGAFGVTLDFIVNILAAPACLPPTALNATAVTSSSASLGWTEAGTASSWDIEWGTLGFTPTGTPTISGATNPQSISGLNSNTTYSFYVRSNCGAGGFSTWSGPFSFTTACVAENVPYSQDFETATVPNLPSCTSQQNVGSGNLWTVENNPGYGFTNKALRYRWNSSNNANVWFYTNGVNLVAGTTYRISYSYGGTGTTFPEKLKVSYGSSANAAAMTNLLADYPNVVNDTPINTFVDFTPSTSGVYYFGFNAYSDADQFYLIVDNILVDVALSSGSFDNANFSAYPNPVKDVLNVSYSTEISSIRVINMIGQEVISKNINATSTQVDMSHLSAGTYIVNVTVGDNVKTLKVVKQ